MHVRLLFACTAAQLLLLFVGVKGASQLPVRLITGQSNAIGVATAANPNCAFVIFHDKIMYHCVGAVPGMS
jgi:hypothetical protein